MSDPHSFTRGDPDILVPRRLATELLDRMEMHRDSVEHQGQIDTWGRRVIAELQTLLGERR